MSSPLLFIVYILFCFIVLFVLDILEYWKSKLSFCFILKESNSFRVKNKAFIYVFVRIPIENVDIYLAT